MIHHFPLRGVVERKITLQTYSSHPPAIVAFFPSLCLVHPRQDNKIYHILLFLSSLVNSMGKDPYFCIILAFLSL
jgi:hypothetical protein